MHYVSINGFNSNLEHFHCSVLQGSILGPLLFLICIDDLNCAIKCCSVHILKYNKLVKRINKHVNKDLNSQTYWLNVNKICLNISKKEVVLFESSRKLTDVQLNLKLNGSRLSPIK